ncbi:MAG: hypothetical protein D6816_18270, partial [Bacteroidetes bacterium]
AAILFALWGTLLFTLSFPQPAAAATGPRCYVKAGASAPDGDSWATAYATVQDALADANCTEIWVAAGVYYPDEGAGQTNDNRSSTFTLKNGVSLYGGFAGTETALSERDVAVNITVLSGDIDQNDSVDASGVVTDTANIAGINVYHVVTGSSTDNTAVLDGFTVTAGNADQTWPWSTGGGMLNDNGSPMLTNIIFSGNLAVQYGGGINNSNNSSPTLTHVTFSGNTTYYHGGGMYNQSSSNPVLNDVVFVNNSTYNDGGGLYNLAGSPTLTNVTFISNSTSNGRGGGMYTDSGNPTLNNVTFSANSASSSSSKGGGMYNTNGNPALTNVSFLNNSVDINNGRGGGMYNEGSPTLTNVTFYSNTAWTGGGMNNYGGSPALTDVTFSGNSATSGGGMYNNGSTPTLNRVTFSSNSAFYGGGGMLNVSSGPILT